MIYVFIYSKVLELIYDKNVEVKCLAIELLIKIANLISEDEQESRILKIFLDHMCNSSDPKFVEKISFLSGEGFL